MFSSRVRGNPVRAHFIDCPVMKAWTRHKDAVPGITRGSMAHAGVRPA